MRTAYYHGGRRGLKVGDLLVPSHPHVVDGCPICIAMAARNPNNNPNRGMAEMRVGPAA